MNRAGIALMEIVFEPNLQDGEEAGALVKELILILQRIKTWNSRMEGDCLIWIYSLFVRVLNNAT